MSLNFDCLEEVAEAMTASGKGILAADESTGTIGNRFSQINTESTFENRNAYRDLLFSAEGMEHYISGVILYDETLRQSSLQDNIPYPQYLSNKGVIPGIKVDMGAHDLPRSDGEKITSGLDGLDERLKEYRKLGARFAKWRAVININDDNPSGYCISANAHALARYAALCQSNDIVPIVEPEILMNGTHDVDDSFVVTEEVLHRVFFELYSQGVSLEQMVLKPNMVLSGYDASDRADVDEGLNEWRSRSHACIGQAIGATFRRHGARASCGWYVLLVPHVAQSRPRQHVAKTHGGEQARSRRRTDRT